MVYSTLTGGSGLNPPGLSWPSAPAQPRSIPFWRRPLVLYGLSMSGRLIGYVPVSTQEQGADPQLDELWSAGCSTVVEEHASGADRQRPELARLLDRKS